jgi:hypothetical protein
MDAHSLFNVAQEFVQGAALSKYVFSYPSGTPDFAIGIYFYLHQPVETPLNLN